jgi:glycosyltransferase involved in cell wall biosynthesis
MLSIVTINRNNADGLSKTIASLQKQSSDNFEWVFIDGNSTDNSFLVAKAFQRQNDVVISESDSGIYNAMNKGITKASGEMIIFLNSGDVFSGSDAIDRIYRHWTSRLQLLLFGFEVRSKVRMPKALWWRFWSMPTSHQALIYSRNLLQQFYFDENYRFAADFEHFLRICRNSLSYKRIQELLVINEVYGSDANLPKVLTEYRDALIVNHCPKLWANFVYKFKTYYLNWVLK